MPLKTQMTCGLLFLLLLAPATALGQQPTSSGYSGPLTKEQLLQSSRWRQVQRRFDEWLSVQRIYNDAQVAQVTARFKQQVTAMNAAQLEDFMAIAEEKLDVLLSNEASEARTYMSFYTDSFLKKQMGKTPDITTMTPTQMRQEFSNFQEQRRGSAAAQGAFNRMQTENAKAVLAERTQARAQAQAAQLAVRNPRNWVNPYYNQPYNRSYVNRGPYAPQSYVAPRPQFSISPWGGVWRTLP